MKYTKRSVHESSKAKSVNNVENGRKRGEKLDAVVEGTGISPDERIDASWTISLLLE